MAKVTVGNINQQQVAKRGWLVGQFMEDGPFKDDNVEICYKTFTVGDPGDKLHQHPVGREYVIVLQGRAKFRVGDDVLEIKKGDYLTIPPGTPDQLIEIIEELTIVAVRTPSVPNNKVFLTKQA